MYHATLHLPSLLAALCCASLQGGVHAQPATPLVEVTGSRIQRPELGANVPTIAVTPEMFDTFGYENFADMATQLPQFGAALNKSRTMSSMGALLFSGMNQASLRNFDPVHTLVLINGRRMPGGNSSYHAVDFNLVPSANIERIEVVTGGASAVYGADAIAGVINMITKKRFEGIELGLSYGAAESGDNRNPAAHMLWGARFGGSARLLATLQVDRQGQVSCRDREICAEDFSWTNPAAPIRGPAAYSTVTPNGRFFVGTTSYTRRNGSFVDASGRLIPFSVTIDGYNRNADRTLAIPTLRTLGALEGEWQLSPRFQLYGELSYGRSRTEPRIEPHFFQSTDGSSLFGTLQATIPVTNPFIPAPLLAAVNSFNATAPAAQRLTALTWFQRMSDIDPVRGVGAERQTARAVLGLRGETALWGRDWRWDLYHVQGATQVDVYSRGVVSTEMIYHGLRVEPDPVSPGSFRCSDAAARAAGCVPINPFADYTPEQRAALRATASSRGRATLSDTVASIAGTLADLPAGALQVAAGVEHRLNEGYLDHAAAMNEGRVSGGVIEDQERRRITTSEVFVEARAPLLADRPGVVSLNVEAALRRSESRGSGYDTWKLGGDWEPVRGLRIRAMRASAVRGPAPGMLSGGGPAFGTVLDPCAAARRNLNPIRAANCAADGVPVGYTPSALIEGTVGGRVGGNPDLAPEFGTTSTYGLVWESRSVKGLTIAIDRFEIDVKDLVGTVARQVTADTCYDTPERALCDAVRRGPHPLVPGAQHVLTAVDFRLRNTAAVSVAGVDVDLKARWTTTFGTFDSALLLTLYDKAEFMPLRGSAPISLLDQAGQTVGGAGYIRKTGLLNLGWSRGPFKVSWAVRYIGSAQMSANAAALGFPRVPAHAYHHLRIGGRIGKDGEIYFGVSNVADKQPPFFASGSGNNVLDTIPGYYDVFGRSYFAGFRQRF